MLTQADNSPLAGLPVWPVARPDRPLAGLTLLVVEDSRLASEAVRLLCLRSGARIRRADCLRSAARHLQSYRPAVAIVDLGLPDGNGADLIRQIAQAEPRVPVVLGMSGDPDARQAAMAAGADGFLAKPVENLALFQQTVLAALPPEMRRTGLRALPDDVIRPGQAGLRDDLTQIAASLAEAPDAREIDYILSFLAGIARSAHDPALEQAVAELTGDSCGEPKLSRISDLIDERLAQVSEV